MAVHVIDEANRCLNCKKPMCMQGCPIHTPIPMMIKAFKEGNLNEAGEMLFENNPMSMICSLVCNHEKQCEGHCVLGRKGEPVHISSIENYVSDTYFDKMQIPCQPKNGKKVAVIGAGPAGITIAILLAKKGYGVTIFDSRDKIGGVLQYGIPAFRLPKSILERYKVKLREIGIKIVRIRRLAERWRSKICSVMVTRVSSSEPVSGDRRHWESRENPWEMFILRSITWRIRIPMTLAIMWRSSVWATPPWMWRELHCAREAAM